MWWVADDGIHMEVVQPETGVPKLSNFDQLSGPLVIEHWQRDPGRRNTCLSAESLHEIASLLDQSRLKPLDELQKAPRAKLAAFNQSNQKSAVKTFLQLAEHLHYSWMLRKRLYLAKDRYAQALEEVHGDPYLPIPKIFHSYSA